MLTITSEVVSLVVSPPRQRLKGDDDDETTCGCLPVSLGVVRPPRQRLNRCAIVQSTLSQLSKPIKHAAIVIY